MAMHLGPKWGQKDRWGRYKCKERTVANGGFKFPGRKKKSKEGRKNEG